MHRGAEVDHGDVDEVLDGVDVGGLPVVSLGSVFSLNAETAQSIGLLPEV